MYKFTVAVNRTLSKWAAKLVLIVKDKADLNLQAKPRLIVNYSYVIKDLPRIEIPLLAEMYNYLLDLHIRSFS